MFNPVRLSIARKRRRLTREGFAALIGLSPHQMGRLEKGLHTPLPETMNEIVKQTGFPAEFFFGGDVDELPVKAASFRSLTGMTGKERDAALAAGSLAYLLSDWVADRFNLPPVDLLNLSYEKDPAKAALTLRQAWNLGEQPVSNMVKLLESKGVRVFSLSENTKNVDAFSCWRNDTPYIFLNTFKSTERSRLDAAHELAHLVMHKHGGPEGRQAEHEANAFASAFLMPEQDVRSRIPFAHAITINQLVKAKKRWGVSVAALVFRLHKLGLITDHRYRSLYIEIAKADYRINEPNALPREESVVWKKVFTELWSEKITKADIANALHLPFSEIENLVFGLNGQPTSQEEIQEKHRENQGLKLVE
jgi:Zn-dependent peptidase ImmA (M78 family)/DNA-binding XRE family transcriptional regulator